MVLSLRRLGGGHRGVGRRANQGPRASPAKRNGGPSGRRNAFRWESRSSGADEACRLRQDEGCAACDGDGRGRARERSEFSPSGGNRAKRTLRGRSEGEESVSPVFVRSRREKGRELRILRPNGLRMTGEGAWCFSVWGTALRAAAGRPCGDGDALA